MARRNGTNPSSKKAKKLKQISVNLAEIENQQAHLKISLMYNATGNNRRLLDETDKTLISFVKKMMKLSLSEWHEIRQMDKNQGYESLHKHRFNPNYAWPKRFENRNKFDVIRLSTVGRLLGFIDEDTFYLVWVDTKFDMYDH